MMGPPASFMTRQTAPLAAGISGISTSGGSLADNAARNSEAVFGLSQRKRYRPMNERKYGFTLIELLIVVVIIAILAAIAAPNFLQAQTRTKVSRVMADMKSVVTAVRSYEVDNNQAIPCAEQFSHAQTAGVDQNLSYYDQSAMMYFIWVHLRPGVQGGAGRLLTTPISYMTNLPMDPFLSKAFGLPASYTWVYAGKGKHRHFKDNDAPLGGFGPHPNADNAPYIKYGERQYSWHMGSFGPDLIQWLGDN